MYSITKNGKPLDKKLYTIDEKTKTFSSNESGLVLDFSDEYGWVFNTNSDCTFKTDSDCTFDTGFGCTFDTGPDCTFDTGSSCTFKTSFGCTFETKSDCTFKTGSGCTFKTGYGCVVVRRDIFEVIELEEGKKIKLNASGIKGYKVLVPKKVREMTVAEVSEKLGYDIKIIK